MNGAGEGRDTDRDTDTRRGSCVMHPCVASSAAAEWVLLISPQNTDKLESRTVSCALSACPAPPNLPLDAPCSYETAVNT